MHTLAEQIEGVHEGHWLAYYLQPEADLAAEPLASILTSLEASPKRATVLSVLRQGVAIHEVALDADGASSAEIKRTFIPRDRILSVTRTLTVTATGFGKEQTHRIHLIVLRLRDDDDIVIRTEPNWYSNTIEEAERRLAEVAKALEDFGTVTT